MIKLRKLRFNTFREMFRILALTFSHVLTFFVSLGGIWQLSSKLRGTPSKTVETFNVFRHQYQTKILKLRKMFRFLVLTFSHFQHFPIAQHHLFGAWGQVCELFKHGIDTFFAAFIHGAGTFYPLKSRYPHAHIHTSRTHNCIYAFKSTPDTHIFADTTF